MCFPQSLLIKVVDHFWNDHLNRRLATYTGLLSIYEQDGYDTTFCQSSEWNKDAENIDSAKNIVK